ncbi:MAG: hypothetical protein FJ253_12240 [Phycisphaerae bacterium]|nr:hypothetical protein [Phycisphaerae bacterium]
MALQARRSTLRRSTIAAWVFAALVLALARCAAPPANGPHALDELERPPADFTLDVAILTGSRVPVEAEAHRRPGHFILLADGSLLHDSGPTVTWDERPGRTRALYQQQVSDLWALARRLGFTSPSNADFIGNPSLLEPTRDETIYVIAFNAAGERWTFVRGFRGAQEPDPASLTLIRALCDLAWSQDLPRERFLPVRYDFGPDPYAGFRRRS